MDGPDQRRIRVGKAPLGLTEGEQRQKQGGGEGAHARESAMWRDFFSALLKKPEMAGGFACDLPFSLTFLSRLLGDPQSS